LNVRSLGVLLGAAIFLGSGAQASAAVGFKLGPGSPLSSGSRLSDVKLDDVNNDGRLDIVAANDTSPGGVSVLLGNGAGGFTPVPGSPFPTGANDSLALAVGDLNHDNSPDVVTANYTPGNVSVLLNNGSGKLSPAVGSPVASGSTHVTDVGLPDANGDGQTDIVTANQQTPGNISVLLGNGAGGFAPASGSPFGTGANNAASLAVGDFSGNPYNPDDVAVANNDTPGSVSVLLTNHTTGAYTLAGSPVPTGGNKPTSVVSAQTNPQPVLALSGYRGPSDVLAANNASASLSSLLGNGSGGLSPASGSPFGVGAQFPVGVAAEDLDGDGRVDAATANQVEPGTVSVLTGNGTGGFAAAAGSPFSTGATAGAQAIAIGSLNGDSQLDVVTANLGATSSLSVLLNTNRPAVKVTPGALDFGDVRRNHVSSRRTLDIADVGPGELRLGSRTLGGPNRRDFAVTADLCNGTGGPATLLVGEVCRLQLTAKPRGRGPRRATLTFDYEGVGSRRTVALSVNTHPPRVSRVLALPSVFAPVGASAGAGRRRRGTTFRYRLSEKATARLVIERPVKGRRRGGKCRRATARNRRGRRCTLYRRVTTLERRAGRGTNRTRFSGRVRQRALRAGRYRVSVTATDGAGNRSPRAARAWFRIVRR
jgi:hypothetical protein